jgi:hypothetical protein
VFPVNTIIIHNTEKITVKAENKNVVFSRTYHFFNQTELAKLEFHLKQIKSKYLIQTQVAGGWSAPKQFAYIFEIRISSTKY